MTLLSGALGGQRNPRDMALTQDNFPALEIALTNAGVTITNAALNYGTMTCPVSGIKWDFGSNGWTIEVDSIVEGAFAIRKLATVAARNGSGGTIPTIGTKNLLAIHAGYSFGVNGAHIDAFGHEQTGPAISMWGGGPVSQDYHNYVTASKAASGFTSGFHVNAMMLDRSQVNDGAAVKFYQTDHLGTTMLPQDATTADGDADPTSLINANMVWSRNLFIDATGNNQYCYGAYLLAFDNPTSIFTDTIMAQALLWMWHHPTEGLAPHFHGVS